MSATVVTSGFGVLLKRGDGGSGAAVQASRTIGSSNSQLVLKAKTAGAAGNSKACEIVVSGNNTALAVSVSATLVTITSKTDGSANPTSTINDIIAKLYQNATFVAGGKRLPEPVPARVRSQPRRRWRSSRAARMAVKHSRRSPR